MKRNPCAMIRKSNSTWPLNLINPGTSQKAVEPPNVKRIRSESAEGYESNTSSNPNHELTPTDPEDENAGVFFD